VFDLALTNPKGEPLPVLYADADHRAVFAVIIVVRHRAAWEAAMQEGAAWFGKLQRLPHIILQAPGPPLLPPPQFAPLLPGQ